MSRVASTPQDHAEPLALPDLLTALDALGVTFRREGEALALKGGSVLTREMREAVAQHKPSLLTVCDLRAGVARLFDYGDRRRQQDPPKGTRQQAFAYQAAQIDKLTAQAAAADLLITGEAGYLDPTDSWAENAFEMLQADLADLTRADAPYPQRPEN